jgi:outer membrane protein OmpA-like peptidoglycan-associated protein
LEEFGPFLHPDGRTLYFSSAGHPGMGQRDFFISRKGQDGKWQKPINLGYPINTNGDETHMIISADGKKAYFSADREGGYGLRDIYSFDINPEIQPFAVTFMKGKVFNKKSDAKLVARFEIIDLFTKQIMAASSSDPISGEFLLSLPAGSSYALNVSAPGFLFFSENYTLEKELKPTDIFEVDIPLQPIEAGESIVLKNIFFATGSAELEAISQTELEKLLEFLNKNPSLKIEISGHTDDVGNEQLNLKLSQARAEAVKSYLVEKGIVPGRLTAKGYGKSKPIAPNTSDATRKLNRRTEFTVLSK